MELHKINDTLENAPTTISNLNVDLIDLWEKREFAKADLDKLKAVKALELKALTNTLKATEIRDMVTADPSIYEQVMALIKIEASYKRKENDIKRVDNKFTGVKKLVEVLKAEAFLNK